jgi:hypothetical protein
MPQMVALAREFEGQPVVVLGINSDEDPSEAHRVIEHFRLPYATLRAENGGLRLYETYKITMWPTAIVLDQEGVVRHVHCGYWPTMRRSLANKVRELLERSAETVQRDQSASGRRLYGFVSSGRRVSAK